MAPEIHNPEPCEFSVDVYAYGILLYSLITGKPPYEDVTIRSRREIGDFIDAVVAGKRPEFPDGVSDQWRLLIEACWQKNPKLRPSFTDIYGLLRSPKFSPISHDDRFLSYRDRISPVESPGGPIRIPRDPVLWEGDPAPVHQAYVSPSLAVRTPRRCNVFLLGDNAPGKTSLIERAFDHKFGRPLPTIGCQRNYKRVCYSDMSVDLVVSDAPGGERWEKLVQSNLQSGADIVLILFALDDESSLRAAKRWFDFVKTVLKSVIFFLVGNKVDLANLPGLSQGAAVLAQEMNARYHKVSAKTGFGVDKLFTDVVEKALTLEDRPEPIPIPIPSSDSPAEGSRCKVA
jgi:GTPase SAR1 family protein